MKTIYHPTLAGVVREVPESQAEAWKAAGWRFTPPSEGDVRGAVEAPAKDAKKKS